MPRYGIRDDVRPHQEVIEALKRTPGVEIHWVKWDQVLPQSVLNNLVFVIGSPNALANPFERVSDHERPKGMTSALGVVRASVPDISPHLDKPLIKVRRKALLCATRHLTTWSFELKRRAA